MRYVCVRVCVCEVYVCEVGMDTQQSFAAMLCVGYKFGGWGEKTTSFLEETTSPSMTVSARGRMVKLHNVSSEPGSV